MLNGVADDNQDIAQGCVAFLEEHGKRMKEALAALGELEEDAAMQEWIDNNNWVYKSKACSDSNF